ncbi:hypothetical protein VTP01DRAFT_6504 [Rhizomucor pusillus]|uniref:uncharacterized protein n=1 Tax=Rhizomucor pusillus TaxID=4840 RepID=UPI003742A96F
MIFDLGLLKSKWMALSQQTQHRTKRLLEDGQESTGPEDKEGIFLPGIENHEACLATAATATLLKLLWPQPGGACSIQQVHTGRRARAKATLGLLREMAFSSTHQ